MGFMELVGGWSTITYVEYQAEDDGEYEDEDAGIEEDGYSVGGGEGPGFWGGGWRCLILALGLGIWWGGG